MTCRRYAVVRWSPERDGPIGSEHIGKVCEILGEEGGRFWLRLPDGQLNIDVDRVLNVGGLDFAVGDQVCVADGRRAEIIDCVWHYAKHQSMYLLGFGRKLSSRRYFADELSVAE